MTQFPSQPIDSEGTPNSVSAMTPQQIAAAAENNLPTEIQEDTTCLTCGYNLRGLMSDGRCPECGMAIGRSLRGNFLKFADPAYVRKLAQGVQLILAGVLVNFLIGILNASVTATIGQTLWTPLIGLAGGMLTLVGTWFVTAPDPSKIDADWKMNSRRFVRTSVVLSLGFNLVSILQTAAGRSAAAAPPVATAILGFLSLVFALVILIAYFAQFVYFRGLALRIPDLKLAKSTANVMWGIVICGGGMIVLLVIGLILTASPSSAQAGGILAMMGTCSGILGLAICSIWWIVLLVAYRGRFAEQADIAERTWAAAGGPNIDEAMGQPDILGTPGD